MKKTERTLYLEEIGTRIRNEREYLGLSREKFAEIVELSPFYIGQIERGDRSMSIDTLVKISNSLKLSTDYILKGVDLFAENISVLESKEDLNYTESTPEYQQLIDIIYKLPKSKIHLIDDIIRLLLPHL